MSFWQSKTKITPADKMFSRIVRQLAGWHCEYRFQCTGRENFEDHPGGLTCSHFHKRAKRSVRYDLRNCNAACRPCHGWVEDTAKGQSRLRSWKEEQLGEKVYRELMLCANLPRQQQMDDKLETLYVRGLRAQLVREGKLIR